MRKGFPGVRVPEGSAADARAGRLGSALVQRIGNRYVLDLRRVAPEQRFEVASSLLGAERGRQFVTNFDRWEAAQGKPLARR